ncbi:MAG: tricarballylate utilization 4Fe-4S protein TcuB [Geminicoccaceae bacterium]|nr:tricarballylate utilization 4Fe-4S protein TcuB [Geminicoccaceae bacterium]
MHGPELDRLVAEARRQLEICNACRYCEGYCAVFPAMTLHRAFSDGTLVQLANLCHGCRACYHACQYAPPHAFAVNLPRALAELRVASWESLAPPAGLGRFVQRRAGATVLALLSALAGMFWALASLRPPSGTGFYAHLSHGAMVAIFLPAFLLPLALLARALRDFWRLVGGGRVRLRHLRVALAEAASLVHLSGGGQGGCQFEKGDRPSQARRFAHQLVFWGFVACFASTTSATIMHYALDWPAPYDFWTPPKLLGVPGGVLMVVGGIVLASLARRADPELGSPALRGGEAAFRVLLVSVPASGLLLWAAADTVLQAPLLALHLATVLAFFLLAPYSKMAHAPFRFAALVRAAQEREAAGTPRGAVRASS